MLKSQDLNWNQVGEINKHLDLYKCSSVPTAQLPFFMWFLSGLAFITDTGNLAADTGICNHAWPVTDFINQRNWYT